VKSYAVVGCCFGDEGKGMVVISLTALSKNPLVIRYSGGQQAAHHVMLENEKDHVFANFGSGTLQGAPTYWSKYCTVDPIGILNELDILKSKGVNPTLYIDAKCPITTPFEKMFNKGDTKNINHGTCGVGVGQTFQREADHYSILAEDLLFPDILRIRLNCLLDNYYSFDGINGDEEIKLFIKTCQELLLQSGIAIVENSPQDGYDTLIYEGSQGLLLDQNYAFFPHVTRSNTGTTNICNNLKDLEIFLVTRAYQTRHGNGPMTNESMPHKIKDNPYEQNFNDGIQGNFRRSILDLDLIKYAITKDDGLKNNNNLSLVITCLDLLEYYCLTINNEIYRFNTEYDFVSKISKELGIHKVFLSRDPYPGLELFKS
jgi:adenylosuccinate synthase